MSAAKSFAAGKVGAITVGSGVIPLNLPASARFGESIIYPKELHGRQFGNGDATLWRKKEFPCDAHRKFYLVRR